jgi:hypothetical protein
LGFPISALARLKAAVGLVDDIDPTFAPHETVVAMAATQRFQRVTDFHSDLVGLSGLAGS